MLEVHQEWFVIEAKEFIPLKSLSFQELMYWQVTSTKTVVSRNACLSTSSEGERNRAARGRFIRDSALNKFLTNRFTKKDFFRNESLLEVLPSSTTAT